MGLETFPEIESFQKLPRQVIVKGGTSRFHPREGAELTGIVINNTGQPIREVRVNAVILDERGMPLISSSTAVDPAELPQGAVGAFSFRFQDFQKPITKSHLFANWRFHD